MAAYLFGSVEITDPAGYAEYSKQVPPTVASYGGRYLSRGGATDVIEGDWVPGRVVIIEFPDMAQLKAWYNSLEYQQLAPIRRRTATTSLVAIQGV